MFVMLFIARKKLRAGSGKRRLNALLLYSLQIAASNLNAFMAEQPKPELAEGEQPQPELAGSEKGKMLEGKNGDEPRLADLLLKPRGIARRNGGGNHRAGPGLV